jgi:hypothetical protein
MFFLLFIFTVSLVLPAWPQVVRKATPAYPSWFWEMPADSASTFAVGYARRYARIDTSFAYARRHSVWQLVRSQQVAVDAGHELHQQFGQSRLIRLTESERIDSTQAPTIAAGFNIVDSAVVGDMVVALAVFPGSSNTGSSNISSQSNRTPPSARPRWVETLPEEESAIYAIGTSPLYYYEHHSWERAEADARRQLAFALTARIRSVNWQAGSRMQTWSESQSSVTLRHAVVVNRWLDMASRQCYVLCRMPIR